MEIILVLHNIRSTHNVGSILRTADGLGLKELVFSGYTPRYNDQRILPHLRAKLNRQIEKTGLGAEKTVLCETVDELGPWLEQQKTQAALILGLENNLQPSEKPRQLILGAENRTQLSKKFSTYAKTYLILGEEVQGIPDEIRKIVDFFLEIPMHGSKESYNVSIAAAIAAWELLNLSN